jgi:hypothetical protein
MTPSDLLIAGRAYEPGVRLARLFDKIIKGDRSWAKPY